MYKRIFGFFLAFLFTASLCLGCKGAEAPAKPQPPVAEPAAEAVAETVPEEPVVLYVAGGWPDCRALDIVSAKFTEQYPNCTVVYEYLQDYYVSLQKRLDGDAPFDLFFTTNIQSDANAELLPYAMDLNSSELLDLGNTFEGLIQNFTFREDGGGSPKLYAVPLGAEMRGLYVNQTLLDSLGIPMPTDQASLLAACATLKENGYIPFQGNPSSFAQTLIYPWICSLIANADDPEAAYNAVNTRQPGISEMFREPIAFLYTLVENGYYDYKKAQTDLELFIDMTDEAYARDFFHIAQKGDGFEKVDDIGQVAFMPSPISLQSVMDKTKDDYHSQIEYTFVLSPIGKDGGYAYLSPAHGIGANKNSANVDWAMRFLDFLFTPENNELFAQAFHIIPNTEEALAYIEESFAAPNSRICELGQVTFDYGFYGIVHAAIVDVAKANNPKYMLDDGTGKLSLYPLDHFMEALEAAFQAQ